MALTAALVLANAVVPMIAGDVYPFTSAPMFRDSPSQCANYRVFAADGSELPADDWLVQRIYDGNPIGYGVGIRPPAVLEQEFSLAAGEAEICEHILKQLERPEHAKHAWVDVVQEVIGAIDGQRVGIIRTEQVRVTRP
jgi:hypothetical protein